MEKTFLITFVMASWIFQMMFILQLASVNKVLEEKEAMMQEALKEQEKGIEFQIQRRMPVPCEIDSYDLCVIFTHLL